MDMTANLGEKSPLPLHPERLTLRLLDDGDAEFMLELLNDADFLSQIGDRGVRTLEDARRYLAEGPLAGYARDGFGMWAVVTRHHGVRLGICGLVRREGLDAVDIGYAFLPDWRGKGYALEASQAVMALAREFFGLRRILAITALDNTASIRMLERLGFGFERTIRLRDNEELRLFAWNA